MATDERNATSDALPENDTAPAGRLAAPDRVTTRTSCPALVNSSVTARPVAPAPTTTNIAIGFSNQIREHCSPNQYGTDLFEMQEHCSRYARLGRG